MTYRDPWTRDIAAMATLLDEIDQQLAYLNRDRHVPVERLRALVVASVAAQIDRIAGRMERRYEREAAARDAALAAQREGSE